MDSYRLGFAIEDFRVRMAALGIDVGAIELANEPSRNAVLATLQPACTVPGKADFGKGVIAKVYGVEIKAASRLTSGDRADV